ncbi:MAG: hypothetical protein KBT06_03140 [Prevotellaceae bacterium]|nr:hypothetical protein [Candidatus Colivivens equi]
MCNYRKENICTVNNEKCPWVYWCDKVNTWKELSKMPKKCKIGENTKAPDGFNKVVFERKGYLYVIVGDQTIKFLNPFDFVPEYVKLYKSKGELKIKK